MRSPIVLLVLAGSLSCGKNLEQQIQQQVANFEHASLGEEQVQVTNIQTMGAQAVAEVQITTGVKLTKKQGKWEIEEFRIGDRRWEKASHILALINEQRTHTTLEQLALIDKGIRQFAASHNQVPQVAGFWELIDTLTPDFQGPVIRLDAWANPFHYQTSGGLGYDLRSAGPDEELGTDDDLRVQEK